jgi:hypothetical protein
VESLAQATVGYNFPFDTSLASGVAYERVAGIDSWYFGLQLTYTYTQCDKCMITAKHY